MNPYELNDRNLLIILKAYEDAYREIARKLKINLSYSNNPMYTKVSQYTIDKYVEQRLLELTKELKSSVPKGVSTAFSIAYAEALSAKYLAEGLSNVSLDKVLKDVPRVMKNGSITTGLAEITMKDLLLVTNNTEYSVKRLVRETFAKHMNVQNMLNIGRKDLAKTLAKELSGNKLLDTIDENMTGIIDRAGRKWHVNTYVDMAVKTKFHLAHVEGVRLFIDEHDGHGDLARIPIRQTTIDACKGFEGLIISMTGRTEGYRTYGELKATNLIFHPRCRHNPVAYWDEESIPNSTIRKHKTVRNKSDKILGNINQ